MSNAITLAAWVKPAQGATQDVIEKGLSSGTSGYELNLAQPPAASTGTAFVRFNGTVGPRLNASSLYPTDGNTWMHVAATYDGATVKMYVNGVLETQATSAFTIAGNTLPLGIGAEYTGSSASRYLKGGVDDARVYNYALTAGDVAALASHTLTVTTVGSGTVGKSPADQPTYTHNTIVTLTANPGPGYLFVGWTGDTTGSGGSLTLPINRDRSITATFAPDNFTLTTDAAPPEGGLVTRDPDLPSYPSGTVVSLTAAPSAGFRFDHWSGGTTGTENPVLVTMDASKSVTAHFVRVYTLTTAVDPVGGGSVGRSSPGPSYDVGTVVSLTATATGGWHFVEWSGGASGAVNPLEVTMDADKSITAKFAVSQYKITASAGTGGTISPVGDVMVNPGADQAFTITANDGYALSQVLVDGAPQGPVATYTFTNVTADHTIAASFVSAGTINVGAPSGPILASTDHVTVPFTIARSSSDPPLMAFSVQFKVSEPLVLPEGKLSIHRGTFLPDGYSFQLIDNGVVGGYHLYQVDASTLGEPCGTDALSGTLFTVDLNATHSGTGTVSIESVRLRNCQNGDITPSIGTSASVLADLTVTLTVTKDGSGTVTQDPEPVLGKYEKGTVVTLTATPAAGWTFGAFSGAVTGGSPATVTMDGDKSVTATFTQNSYTLTVVKVGNGTVVKDPEQASYHYGDVVTLTATADAGWTFAGFTGDASGGSPLAVTIDGNKSVTATFTQNSYTLTVVKVGNGTVVKDPEQASYHYGDVVTLTATADAGWTFAGFTGDASGGSPLAVTIDGNKSVTATFTQNSYTLTVVKVGNGTVVKDPEQASYHYGDVVTLTATADAGWTFAGFTGDASGGSPLAVTIDGNKSVTATFTQNSYTLTVVKVGNGTVVKDPEQASYHYGDVVTLTATADAGWTFAGFTGDASGGSPLAVTIDGNKSVTATFTQNSYTLTVVKVGNGTVVKDPEQASYHYGDVVTLTATADAGWTFAGFTGDASGGSPLAVTIDGNKSVTATFTQNSYTLTVVKVGNGTVAKDAGARRATTTVTW